VRRRPIQRRVTPGFREARFPKAEPLASLCILSSCKKVWARPGLRGNLKIRRIFSKNGKENIFLDQTKHIRIKHKKGAGKNFSSVPFERKEKRNGREAKLRGHSICGIWKGW
jgi:hypothetical protein